MKKISMAKIKKELIAINADAASTEIVISTVEHHNDLVDDYNNDEKRQQYLCYQLKQQTFKMLQDLKKLNQKLQGDGVDDDDFNAVVKAISKNKAAPVIGFVAKKNVEPK
jgi:DNA repair ATPase RecN